MQQWTQMGMPITIDIDRSDQKLFTKVFDYFAYVDQKFSTYRVDSEISLLNTGKLKLEDISADMRLIFELSEKTKKETNGFFDIYNGKIHDPSGIVKGWAINNASELLIKPGAQDFYLDVGGDIQTHGKTWSVGIRHPFEQSKIVKKLKIQNLGVATSGIYERGKHIYDPKNLKAIADLVSFTVIGPNIYEADRMATAAFAMGKAGIHFIDKLNNFAGMVIDQNGIATYTHTFSNYVEAN